jgi:hypothetical protein
VLRPPWAEHHGMGMHSATISVDVMTTREFDARQE